MGDHSHHGHDMGHTTLEPVEHRGLDSDGPLVDAHGNHGPPGSLHSSMMSMWFHFGMDDTILFEFWKPTEVGTLIASMIVIFLISFLYEALKFYREHLYRKSFRTIQYNTVTVPVENGGALRETQKAVQIGMQSFSVDPDFEVPEITPIFISQGPTCSCPASVRSPSESKVDVSCEDDGTMATHPCPPAAGALESNNNLNRGSPMGGRRCSATISTNVSNAYKVKMLSWMHSWQTILHVVQVILSYLLMLIFMTYNVWLCLAVILGAGSGYFFFGWKKSLVVDITEHCH